MVTRVNGFSGMDIDSLVKNMMKVKRVPLDKTNQNKQLLQWQRESYREVNSKLYDFRNNKLSLSGYRASASLNAQTAVIKDSSGTVVDASSSAVKAKATANANGVAMKVSVAQVATATSLKIEDSNTIGAGYNTSQSLAQIMKKKDATVLDGEIPAKFTLNLSINGNDKSISFDKDTTLASVLSKINSDSDLNVQASFDEVTGQLALSSKATGESQILTAGSAPSSFLKLMSKDGSGKTESKAGQNSVFSINNNVLNSDSNTVVYNGVELTLQAKTGNWDIVKQGDGKYLFDPASTSSNDKPLTVTTTVDAQKALDTMKSFISDYNSLISSFNGLVSEEKYSDFSPLTDEQRSAMNESDINAWEKKAKSGMLKNDSILKSVLADMRSAIGSQLGALSSMGITTGSYYENGKLYIDEKKFKEAVEANPQQLIEALQGTETNTKDSVFGKFVTALDGAMDKIAARAGTSKFDGSLNATFKSESVMERQLKDYNSRILTLTTQLTATENRYYKQFTAMESAMSKYQSQLSQLTGASS